MTCQEFGAVLVEFVDGTLDDRSRAACQAHVDACSGCDALAGDLTAIRVAARTLEPLIPSARVWSRIASDLDHRGGRPFFGLSSWWHTAAASLVGATIVASLAWTGARLGSLNDDSTRVASAVSPLQPMDTDYRRLDAQLATTIAGLESIQRGDDALDPETADVVQASLTLIDDAIVESRVALEAEPDNRVAQESLFEALRRKVELLQNMIALVNEMRKGDPEGAARILSGLDQ